VSGVIVEVVGGDATLAHEIALHVASMRPEWLSPDDVPPDRVESERAVLETLTRNEGKPEAAIPKIVEGRLKAFFRDHCLLEQPFVKDQKQSVSQVLGPARVTRFVRVEIGR
jgi:elongation factor Ts